MGRRKQFLSVKEDVISHDLNSGYIARVDKVREFDMEAAEETLHRDLQHVEFDDVKLDSAILSGSECADELNGKRNNLVYDSVQLELIPVGLNRDLFERCIGRSAGVKVVTDITYIGADEAFLNLQDKRFRVIEGRIDLPMGANHLSTNPANIDAEVRAFTQQQIMRIHQGWSEIISGRERTSSDVALIADGRRRRSEPLLP